MDGMARIIHEAAESYANARPEVNEVYREFNEELFERDKSKAIKLYDIYVQLRQIYYEEAVKALENIE